MEPHPRTPPDGTAWAPAAGRGRPPAWEGTPCHGPGEQPQVRCRQIPAHTAGSLLGKGAAPALHDTGDILLPALPGQEASLVLPLSWDLQHPLTRDCGLVNKSRSWFQGREQVSPQGEPCTSAPATVMDHLVVRQKCFNGPRTKPTATPSPPCSVDHQAAADRRQELEETLEEERLSG